MSSSPDRTAASEYSEMPTTTTTFVGIRELSRMLGLSINSIQWHRRMGRIPFIRLGRKILYDPLKVIEYLQNRVSKTRPKS